MDQFPMVTLEGVDGSQIPLLAMGDLHGSIWLRKGAKGLDMPPWDVQADEYPARDGEFPRAQRALAREIFLPLTLVGDSRPELVATKRRLLEALPPSRMARRMARLVTAEYDEADTPEPQREIEVYYKSGLEGDEDQDVAGLRHLKYGLILRSTDPWFRAREDTRIDFLTFEEQVPFFPPEGEEFVSVDGLTGGFKVSPAPTFVSETSFFYPGSVSVKPTWHLQGPINEPFALVRAETNYSPEESLVIDGLQLEAGETATLVTTPGQVKLSTSAGVDITWSALGTNPRFWYIDPGVNTVSIDGLTTEPGAASFTYRTKYLGM
ncbi:hypothetical protein E1264_03515 [Actinomadura sp. KC216]|uniref:hypothetical protein n=1 Tax=Actinomadura sp. KC216 TaxID=2530370 RepID=UPI001052E47E|nr:hypothetical protein [Actinomadura sp. KC216]TDB90906.1 hypothetical protein E1264_03515 [Actinomadura sp. KC216]